MLADIIAFSQAHGTELFAALWSLSELLALSPSVKSNGIFHLIQLILTAEKEAKKS